MPGNATRVRHYCLCLVHDEHKLRRRMLGHKDRVRGKSRQVFIGFHMKRRSESYSWKSDGTSFQKHRIALHDRNAGRSVPPESFQVKRSSLEHENSAVRINGPFHVLRILIMFLKLNCVRCQCSYLFVGEAGRILFVEGYRSLVQARTGGGHKLNRFMRYPRFRMLRSSSFATM